MFDFKVFAAGFCIWHQVLYPFMVTGAMEEESDVKGTLQDRRRKLKDTLKLCLLAESQLQLRLNDVSEEIKLVRCVCHLLLHTNPN